MCGIAGVIDPLTPPDRALLRRMANHLRHRGPDDAGFHIQDEVGLCHQRLSIIDLGNGRQPMFNEDETLALVFNGEIYEYQRHREKLLAQGHSFRTNTDSEVLLHLYEEHGEGMLQKLNGMFVFGIYDFARKELFLARDRLGQKPLFYATEGNRFAFASGPASLRELDWVDTSLDPQAIHSYLEFFYIPTPLSIHKGIKKLPPGHFGRFSRGEFTVEAYWKPHLRPDTTIGYEDACHALSSKLGAAVKRRLVADVPVGLFLSGGMDSSLICALATQHCRNAKTYSIGFPDERYDERDYAEQVAKHLGTEHHFLEVQPNDFSRLDEIVRKFEEPYADSSMLPTVLLSEFTRQHVTVALSGDAADELFGGYYRYRVYHLYERLRSLPAPLQRGLRGMLLSVLPEMAEERSFVGKARRSLKPLGADGLERYLQIIARPSRPGSTDLYGERMEPSPLTHARDLLAGRFGSVNSTDDIMELELQTYLNDDILVKVDRASMAHSLEVRSPFLDPEVVDLALSLPYEFKQKGKMRKRILRDAFKGLLPMEIFDRRKMGFGVPVATWLRGDWSEPVQELLLNSRLTTDGWFERQAVEKLLSNHAGRVDNSYAIFALTVLGLWLEQNSC